jgi:hypothetical protein
MNARYERLCGSGDPVLREIGTQLRGGQVRPAELLAVPEYRRAIRRGVALLAAAAGEGDPRKRIRSAP